MLTKVAIDKKGEVVTVSNFSYLKHTINPAVKHIIESLISQTVSQTERYVTELLKPSSTLDSLFPIKTMLQSVTSMLHFIMRVNPELSIFILSYELKDDNEFPKEYSTILPQWKSSQTFLNFYIKYVCYLGSFLVPFFLEAAALDVYPLYLEYMSQPILLNAYNELLIHKAVIKALEETLLHPEDLFKSIYSLGTWKVLGQISTHLLGLFHTQTDRNFRIEIISDLTSLCYRALQIYRDNSDPEDKYSENTQTVYLFLLELSALAQEVQSFEDISVYHKDIKSFSKLESKFNNLLTSHDRRPWLHNLIKERSYTMTPFSFFERDQGTVQDLAPINTRDDEIVLRDYVPKFETLDTEKLLSKSSYLILELNLLDMMTGQDQSYNKYLHKFPQKYPYDFPQSSQDEFFATLHKAQFKPTVKSNDVDHFPQDEKVRDCIASARHALSLRILK